MTAWEEALAIVLKLPVGDRLRLVEYVVASVEHEIATPTSTSGHWGRDLMDFVDSLDLSVWESDETPEAWVRRIREEQANRHQADWGIPE